MQSSSPVTVEALGLPGAGKTTFIDTLADMVKRPIMRDDLYAEFVKNPQHKRALDILRWLPLRTIIKSAEHVLAVHQQGIGERNIALSLPYHEAILSKYRTQNTKSLLLLDQWTIQAAWSVTVGYEKKDAHYQKLKLIEHYIKLQPRSVLYFDISPDLAASRIANRTDGASRFDGKTEAQITEQLWAEYESMNALVTHLHKIEIPILTLNAADPIEDNLPIAIKWILANGVLETDLHG